MDAVMAALRAAETPEEEARLLDDRRALRGRLTALRAAVEATPARLVDTGRTLADDWHAAEAAPPTAQPAPRSCTGATTTAVDFVAPPAPSLVHRPRPPRGATPMPEPATLRLRWFAYRQNNSGGEFCGPHVVYVQAEDADAADAAAVASELVYFDPEYVIDCDCCGTRWDYASEHDALPGLPQNWRDPRSGFRWPGIQSAAVYADGTIAYGLYFTHAGNLAAFDPATGRAMLAGR